MSIPTVPGSELPSSVGTLYDVVQMYKVDLAQLQTNVQTALDAVKASPSDPGALADFQAAQADYTTFKQFVSTLVKSYQDVNSGILRNIG